MANIQAKKKPVIKKGEGYIYIPETFQAEHAFSNFKEAANAQEILDNIKPMEFMGRKFLFFDTETHPHYKNSSDVPKGIVRRWVGKGKKAVPQDYPFCFQVCDGVNAYALYDSIENGFREIRALAPLFLDITIEFVAHNTKFDMHMLANADVKIVGKLHDTVVQAKLADENRMSYELKRLAARNKKGIVKFEYMVENYKQVHKITDYRDIPRELLTQYGCADVWNCGCVFVSEYDKLIADELEGIYEQELEVMIALYAMERYGMQTDLEYKSVLIDSLRKTVEENEAEVYRLAGGLFNINSNMQLTKVMMNLGVDESVLHYTDKKNVKLDAKEMERLDEIYNIPIIKLVQAYKKAEKLYTTYAIGIYSQVDAAGKVHGSINQTEATTGRMSITKPALQTLPKKDKRIRKMFLPMFGDLLFMDLDQIEYRLFGHYAQATGLINAINDGYDVHAATAAIIFSKDIADITDSERAMAKTVNFALVYGQGNEHTAEMLHMTMSETIAFKAKYFAGIPEARPFINTVHAVIKQRGFVRNFYGRIRRLDANDAYKAPNSLIQGCAADYIKSKLVVMYKYMRYYELVSQMLNIVHDELILDVIEAEKDHAPKLRWLLSDFDTFRCKITAGSEIGCPSWGEKQVHEIPFMEPEDKGYLDYNVFDGHVFDIDKEVVQ